MNEDLPSSSELLQPILYVLEELGGEADTSTIEAHVVRHLNISPELVSRVRVGKRTELGYRLSWARTRGKNLGFLEKKGNKKWALVKN